MTAVIAAVAQNAKAPSWGGSRTIRHGVSRRVCRTATSTEAIAGPYRSSVRTFLPSGVDFRNEDVLAHRLSRSEERSASIDNSGRAERDSVRRVAGNICSNDHHSVVPGPRDIDGPAESHHIGPFRRQAVVAWQENGLGAACNRRSLAAAALDAVGLDED